jgi:hypothetical protein
MTVEWDSSIVETRERRTAISIWRYVVRDLEERFGAEARSAFMQGYGPLPWDSGKADYYRDLYEFF